MNEGMDSFGLLCSISELFSNNNLRKQSDVSFYDMMEQFEIINNKKKIYNVRFYLSCTFGNYKEDFNDEYINKLMTYIKILYEKIKLYKLSPINVDIVLCDTVSILDKNIYIQVLNEINKIDDIMKYIALHLHVENNNFNEYIDIALNYNIHKFDSSILNIGGCPYSGKKNIGNINTVELIKYLERNNYDTGIKYESLKYIEQNIKDKMMK